MGNTIKWIIVLLILVGLVSILTKYPDESLFVIVIIIIIGIGYLLMDAETDSSSN